MVCQEIDKEKRREWGRKREICRTQNYPGLLYCTHLWVFFTSSKGGSQAYQMHFLWFCVQGDKLYSSVLYPCWDATPSLRPSFAHLAAVLAAQLGEEEVADYAKQAASYDQRREFLRAPPNSVNAAAAGWLSANSGPAPIGEPKQRNFR